MSNTGPGTIDGDFCDTNHPGPHSPDVCIHTVLDHDICCYLPQGCLGGCRQPGGCMVTPLGEMHSPEELQLLGWQGLGHLTFEQVLALQARQPA